MNINPNHLNESNHLGLDHTPTDPYDDDMFDFSDFSEEIISQTAELLNATSTLPENITHNPDTPISSSVQEVAMQNFPSKRSRNNYQEHGFMQDAIKGNTEQIEKIFNEALHGINKYVFQGKLIHNTNGLQEIQLSQYILDNQETFAQTKDHCLVDIKNRRIIANEDTKPKLSGINTFRFTCASDLPDDVKSIVDEIQGEDFTIVIANMRAWSMLLMMINQNSIINDQKEKRKKESEDEKKYENKIDLEYRLKKERQAQQIGREERRKEIESQIKDLAKGA